MLPESCEILWRAYLAAEKFGVRAELVSALERFIAEINKVAPEIRDAWVHDISRRIVDERGETVVRLPLFREVVFPALLNGHRARLPSCARWLAGFSQLLYKSPASLEQLPEQERSEYGLLLHALTLDADDRFARERLLRILRSRFEYALHELPAGVLYGQDGATPEQCNEMEKELRFFKQLTRDCGTLHEDEALLEKAGFHIFCYRDYLQTRSTGDTYEAFLKRQR